VNKFLRNNIFIIVILIAGFFFRVYHLQELFYYSHDNDLAGWFIKDVVIDHHPRLIGQETSMKTRILSTRKTTSSLGNSRKISGASKLSHPRFRLWKLRPKNN
jgi:hypothetical protein